MKPLGALFVVIYYVVGLVSRILHPTSVEGLENLPERGALLCPNHSSNWDPILVALLIAIFDILPVLGTGGIMIPWVILSALGGDLPHAFALLVLYVIITVIRNIIEPRIVGAQIGLHPVLTLMSMFVGNHLFGIVGLFGLPILLSLLRYLNDNGTISLFPASALGRADTETSR